MNPEQRRALHELLDHAINREALHRIETISSYKSDSRFLEDFAYRHDVRDYIGSFNSIDAEGARSTDEYGTNADVHRRRAEADAAKATTTTTTTPAYDQPIYVGQRWRAGWNGDVHTVTRIVEGRVFLGQGALTLDLVDDLLNTGEWEDVTPTDLAADATRAHPDYDQPIYTGQVLSLPGGRSARTVTRIVEGRVFLFVPSTGELFTVPLLVVDARLSSGEWKDVTPS